MDQATLQILLALATLLIGIVLSRTGSKVINHFYRLRHGESLGSSNGARIFSSFVNLIAVLLALGFIEIKNTESSFPWYGQMLVVLSVVLLIVLVVNFVNLLFLVIKQLINTSGILLLIRDTEEEPLLDAILLILRIIFYVIFSIVALQIKGFELGVFAPFLGYVFLPLFILFLLLVFYASRDFVTNTAFGFFFKMKHIFREGEQIKYNGAFYTIEEISHLGILVKGKDKFGIFIPFTKLFTGDVMYLSIKTEFDSLEKIKEKFVEQRPSYCGPASAAMILKVFGFEIEQDTIGDLAKTIVPKMGEPGGTHPDSLIQAVHQLTDGKVEGMWISVDKISDFGREARSWLHDNALLIIDYKKSALFPSAQKAHYSVALGVSGSELLILDPSGKTGGVYYADIRNVYTGMNTYSELIKGKRGYIVFALKGTRAYYRLQNGLIYADPTLYSEIAKTFNSKTFNLDVLKGLRAPPQVDKILPEKLKTYLDNLNKEKVSRVWKP
jgi:hypothetical protein